MSESVSGELGSAGPDLEGGAPAVRVLGFDHLVVRVSDPEVSLRFYVGTLGLKPERVDEWHSGAAPFPSVRVSRTCVIDLDDRSPRTGQNVDHFCLEIAPADLRRLFDSGAFTTVGDPVRRWGARGPADLIYVRDPDGNVIELRHYGESAGFGYGIRG
jgi:catechol 2,3-dioxygenase-like lactoylglutathione lyase family enzyme